MYLCFEALCAKGKNVQGGKEIGFVFVCVIM